MCAATKGSFKTCDEQTVKYWGGKMLEDVSGGVDQ